MEAVHCPLNPSRGVTGQLLLRAVTGWSQLWIEQTGCLRATYISCGLPVSPNLWPSALLLCFVTVSVNIPVDLYVLLSLLVSSVICLCTAVFPFCHSVFLNQTIVSN